MDKFTDTLKKLPWEFWAAAGAVVVAIVVFNKGFDSLIGKGGSELATTTTNVVKAGEAGISEIGNTVVTGAGNTISSLEYIFTGGAYGNVGASPTTTAAS